MTRTASARAKDKATKLHSILVRRRGACENVWAKEHKGKLECAHIVPRTYATTRTALDNAFCLCSKCHFRFHQFGDEWMDFIYHTIGSDKYEELKERAHLGIGVKVDWPAELERLQAIAHADA